MAKHKIDRVTRREREIINALFALDNRASVEAIRSRLDAPPSDSSVRVMLARLEAKGIVAKTLSTSHAFHSAMMDEAVAPFEALVRETPLAPPALPIYSTLTGRLLSSERRALTRTAKTAGARRRLSNKIALCIGDRDQRIVE